MGSLALSVLFSPQAKQNWSPPNTKSFPLFCSILQFINLICSQFLSQPEGLPPKFIEQLIGLLGLGSVQASADKVDPSIKASAATPGVHTTLPPSVHRPSTDLATGGVGTDLRPHVSRETFMRLCFESLLAFAFFKVEGQVPAGNGTGGKKLSFSRAPAQGPHAVLCRSAVRDVLERCRFILVRFAKSAQLTGKCPLPR